MAILAKFMRRRSHGAVGNIGFWRQTRAAGEIPLDWGPRDPISNLARDPMASLYWLLVVCIGTTPPPQLFILLYLQTDRVADLTTFATSNCVFTVICLLIRGGGGGLTHGNSFTTLKDIVVECDGQKEIIIAHSVCNNDKMRSQRNVWSNSVCNEDKLQWT